MLEARELFSIRQLELRGPGDTNSSSIRSAGLTRTCLWRLLAFWQDSSWHDGNDQLRLRHSSRPRAGRSTDIRIECSAVYTLRCLYMARITSREETFRIAWILPLLPTVTPL